MEMNIPLHGSNSSTFLSQAMYKDAANTTSRLMAALAACICWKSAVLPMTRAASYKKEDKPCLCELRAACGTCGCNNMDLWLVSAAQKKL